MSHVPSPPKRQRPFLVRLLIRLFLAGVALVLMVVVAVVALAFWPDSSPPQDADMRPEERQRNDDNPFSAFLKWSQSGRLEVSRETLGLARARSNPQSAAAADSLLAENAAAFAQFDALANSVSSAWSWPANPPATAVDQGQNYKKIGSLLDLMSLQVQRLVDQGKVDEAVQKAVKMVQVARAVLGASDSAFTWLVGTSAYSTARSAIEMLATRAELAEGHLEWLQRELMLAEPAAGFIQDVLEFEYVLFEHNLDEVLAGRVPDLDPVKVQKMAGRFVNRNDSLREYLGQMRPLFDALPSGWPAVSVALDEAKAQRLAKRGSLFFWVSSNALGRRFAWDSAAMQHGIIGSAFQALAKHRLAVCELAIRRHHIVHKSLPQKLQELVPAFLPAVPIDPFDAKPLKWKLDGKYFGWLEGNLEPVSITAPILYSSDRNGTDDGGKIDKRTRLGEGDLGFLYWWHRHLTQKSG